MGPSSGCGPGGVWNGYAISTVDQRKLQKAVAAFQVAFADSRQTAADLATQPTAAATAAGASSGDGVLAQIETRPAVDATVDAVLAELGL